MGRKGEWVKGGLFCAVEPLRLCAIAPFKVLLLKNFRFRM